jgi:PHD/YefM family antitoxin component YafN of YafNO toxin-antitoxin module
MPVIKPVSELRNYTAVLQDIAVGRPVFLTKNGRGRYVMLDIEDYEKIESGTRLMGELVRGRKAGEEQGWETIEDLEAALGISL